MQHCRIAAFVFSIFIFSCKASKDQPKNDVTVARDTLQQGQVEQPQVEETKSKAPLETLIIGNWKWWKTVCCARLPNTETSESLPKPKILKFASDGTLQYFSGSDLTSSQTYKISYGLMNDDRPIITIGATRPAMLFINGDTLIIDYGYVDLQTEYYLRQP